MDLADLEQEYRHQSQGQGQNNYPGGSGLLRFRSAPSFLFASACENLDSSEERLLSSVLMNRSDDHLSFPDFEAKPSLIQLAGGGATAAATRSSEVPQLVSPPSPVKIGRSDMLPPQYPRQNNSRSSSGLSRQSSSPAGFFSNFNMPNGYGPVGGIGSFRMGTGSSSTGTSSEVGPSPSGMNEQVTFASRGPSSSLGLLSRISEVGDEGMDMHSPTSSQQKHGSSEVPFFRSGYPVNSWDDSVQFLENSGNSQNEQAGSRPRILAHHLSLPKSSMEMSTMEKLMQFPDSVPCKIRAKRGCATHPRSIAERVRRTRISERMRKLQELVPNMDKQTNTSDMLDLAVDYVQDLQKQFRMLIDNRAKCKCASKLLIPKQPY